MTTLTARWATDAERERWDDLVNANPTGGDFLQTSTMAETKVLQGLVARYVVFERDGEVVSASLFQERSIPVLGKHWRGNRAPATGTVAAFEEHVDALRRFIRANVRGLFVLTLEPPIVSTPEAEASIAASASLSAPDIQRGQGVQANRHTVLIDLEQSDDELLASFNAKCRNKVRRAMRDGVEVREYPANRETFDRMHELMRSVGGGEKAGLNLRPHDYAESLWSGCAERGQGKFFGVDAPDGQPAVMAFAIRTGTNGFYKDGGSQRELVSPGMANLMQYEIMRWLRDEGATTYDMFGVAAPEAKSNEDDGSYASGLFKLAFADRTSHVGAFDLIVRRQQYALWNRIGERAYSKLYRKRTGDIWIN